MWGDVLLFLLHCWEIIERFTVSFVLSGCGSPSYIVYANTDRRTPVYLWMYTRIVSSHGFWWVVLKTNSISTFVSILRYFTSANQCPFRVIPVCLRFMVFLLMRSLLEFWIANSSPKKCKEVNLLLTLSVDFSRTEMKCR